MILRFSFEALSHIDSIHFYIGHRSSIAAEHVLKRIFSDCDRLADFPHLGHAGIVADTFEWTVSGLPYVVVYEIDQINKQIIVLGVFHGAQRR